MFTNVDVLFVRQNHNFHVSSEFLYLMMVK